MEKKSEDLGIEIGNQEELAWRNIKKGVIVEIARMGRELIINKGILKLAEKKIEEERKKFISKDDLPKKEESGGS